MALRRERRRLGVDFFAELTDRLVLLVADALDGGFEFVGDFRDRPTFAGQPEDSPLPLAEDFVRHLIKFFVHFVPRRFRALMAVGDFVGQAGELAGPLGPLLDGIDCPQEFLAVIVLLLQEARPLVRLDALQETNQNLLSTVLPTVGAQPGVAPADLAVARNIGDGISGWLGGLRFAAEGRARSADDDGRHQPPGTRRGKELLHGRAGLRQAEWTLTDYTDTRGCKSRRIGDGRKLLFAKGL